MILLVICSKCFPNNYQLLSGQLTINIMSDRSHIIHSRGGFLRLSVLGKYYW
ncbi:hypothetical protein QUA79_08650 [Microcoleus sp. F8-D1]